MLTDVLSSAAWYVHTARGGAPSTRDRIPKGPARSIASAFLGARSSHCEEGLSSRGRDAPLVRDALLGMESADSPFGLTSDSRSGLGQACASELRAPFGFESHSSESQKSVARR